MDENSMLYLTLYIMTLGIIVEAIYQKLKPFVSKEERAVFDLKDELIPIVVGVLVVLAFYPNSIFQWMPFYPQWLWLDIFLTSLIISRGANASHETYKTFGSFIQSFIGRIRGI